MMSKTYGTAADVWSFGLTLLAVVLGKYPLLKSHEKSNYWDLMRVICDESPPRINNKFSKNLQSFVNSCLFKNPDERASVKKLLLFSFVEDLDLPAASTRDEYQQHAPLSAFTVQGQVLGSEAGSVQGSSSDDAMLVKFAHLETVLEKTEVKYQLMVELWKKQGYQSRQGGGGGGPGNEESSFRSVSFRSISMKSPAEPMTRLPNFVSGSEQWKHLAAQLHLPLDIVLSTATTIINRKYFAK
jgi:serine/threonine protein kinase